MSGSENLWNVNMISAYGRGETLALALQENGFNVQIFDFTEALGPEWDKGAGPFPVASTSYLLKQQQFLEEVRVLPRGMTFWLPEGPLELSGPMADFYSEQNPAVNGLRQAGPDFEKDWLRRFNRMWTSAFHWESWQPQIPSPPFPLFDKIGLVPATKEARLMSFERYQTLEHKILPCQVLRDIQFEGPRITELEVECGRREAYRAPQWIWCLSSEESDRIGVEVSQALFSRGIRKAEWRWLSFHGACDRGPWSQGFPEYTVLINDLHLPWTYANTMILRWTDLDVFQIWMKVPASGCMKEERREAWAEEARLHLHQRLPQASWTVDAKQWSLCPHSPVFDIADFEESIPSWKNWDWIAPETISRLDLNARLEREATCYQRLQNWRNEQIKKQGARRDHALHAP